MTNIDCLTDNQLRTFRHAFEHYDKNKEGLISFDSVPRALKAIGIIVTADDYNSIVQTCNYANENMIDLPGTNLKA